MDEKTKWERLELLRSGLALDGMVVSDERLKEMADNPELWKPVDDITVTKEFIDFAFEKARVEGKDFGDVYIDACRKIWMRKHAPSK